MYITADQRLVRRLNSSVVLNTLRKCAPLSRAELAAKTGLNRSTISSIIKSLLQQGLVQETKLQSDRMGRPGMMMQINPAGGFAVGIEIGVDYISAMVTDFVATLLWRQNIGIDVSDGQEAILARVLDVTDQAIAAGRSRGMQPLGIGIGVPGLVDLREGVLLNAPHLGWTNVPMRAIWSQRYQAPVFVENESNAAALGEYYFGAAQGVNNFVYISAGIGLGGGIIIGGKLFRGSHGYAAEIGHFTIDLHGEPCVCGKRGCLETFVNPIAVVERVKQTLSGGMVSTLLPIDPQHIYPLTFEMVIEAARKGDPISRKALEEVGENLAIGIGNLINILNPQMVVLGGALSLASDMLVPIVEKAVEKNSLAEPFHNAKIIPSAMGTDVCVMGTIALVLDDILREPAFS
jgi:glucokinase-like ROK family protein